MRDASQCRAKRTKGGFALLELIVACTMLLALLVMGLKYSRNHHEHSLNEGAAQQLKLISEAAKTFYETHKLLIEGNEISVAELKESGVLSEQVLERNPYGQRYRITILPSEENEFMESLLVFTEGGEEISIGNQKKIAALSGEGAG